MVVVGARVVGGVDSVALVDVEVFFSDAKVNLLLVGSR